MPDPVLPGLILLGAILPGKRVASGGPTPPSDGKWMFPVAPWRDYAPTVSDEYSATQTAEHREHHGCDIMYRRKPGGADVMWSSGVVNGVAHGTKHYFMPDSRMARAARDGTLWEVGSSGHGKFVVIDHGKPFATFYTHLSSTLWPYLQRGAGGIRVKAGDHLGVIGYSPMDAERLMHLHFEIWYNGGSEAHVNPWPILETAPLPEDK
jgi:murein DD-endopeptidase MepM/ murein hydrolase activator NlpD